MPLALTEAGPELLSQPVYVAQIATKARVSRALYLQSVSRELKRLDDARHRLAAGEDLPSYVCQQVKLGRGLKHDVDWYIGKQLERQAKKAGVVTVPEAPPLGTARRLGLSAVGLLDIDSQGAIYQIESLLAVRPAAQVRRGRQFLVRWAGYDNDSNSWEDEASILDASLIRAFDRSASVTSGSRREANADFLMPAETMLQVGLEHQVTSIPEPSESEPLVRPGDTHVSQLQIEKDGAMDTAALMTAAAFGPMNAWSCIAPSNDGLGLFARVPLKPNQAISEYGGPRLPVRMHTKGHFVLQVPGTQLIIDGACENSPFPCPSSPAVFANHSGKPNARIETWPVDQPVPLQLRQQMVLVAIEHIPAGAEIRIDYEDGSPGVLNLRHAPCRNTEV